jgi:hypothetical protein
MRVGRMSAKIPTSRKEREKWGTQRRQWGWLDLIYFGRETSFPHWCPLAHSFSLTLRCPMEYT